MLEQKCLQLLLATADVDHLSYIDRNAVLQNGQLHKKLLLELLGSGLLGSLKPVNEKSSYLKKSPTETSLSLPFSYLCGIGRDIASVSKREICAGGGVDLCVSLLLKMAEPSSSPSPYRPAPLASMPPQLDPAEYDTSLEKRRAEAERLAIRARLKRQYLLQLNDPRRTQIIEDIGVNRWNYARMNLVASNFRFTPKTSLLSAVFGVGPVLFWWYVFKTDRDHKEKLRQEGKYEQPFHLGF
ncbi:NADH dehydrogenase [ubiquinone] 1 beta subcomplex subunit 4 [Rhineura floridana]|uniref:NADH dehydrogenase [ubiquinone] 1 beta subcomplex subunit 4 n=1 Tax=Rhineura floridana TaxID=261503 RepID=UPI002AC7EE86|nr:NADH dehydrogenase [ubiquinone] 1 beta subcomplex subunit 4 [Rhineura floridana]